MFAGSRLRRTDHTRAMIVWEVERLFEKKNCPATARDFALASILCGLFPVAIKIGPRGVTVAQVIDAEVRAMREAQRRLRTDQTSTQSPAR